MKKKTIGLIVIILTKALVYGQDLKFGKVSKEELQEAFYPLDSTANAAYLQKKRKTYFVLSDEGSFNIVTEVHDRIKIYNKKGIEKGNFKIKFYVPDSGEREDVYAIKGYSFSLNKGAVEKVKINKSNIFVEKVNKFWSVTKIVTPNVTEGTVIDLKYTKISPYLSIDNIQFQYDIPVKKYYSSTEIPEYYKYNIKTKGYYHIMPKKTTTFDSKVFYSKSKSGSYTVQQQNNTETIQFTNEFTEYIANNIPSLKGDEPYVNNINNYRGGLSLELTQTNFLAIGGSIKNYATSWSDVSKKILLRPSFGVELEKQNYYKKELNIAVSGAKTDIEKVIKTFNFVKSKVKWNRFKSIYTNNGVKKAFKDRVGNVAEINLMLTSMLRFLGINANPVLVSTKDHQVPLFPTINGFNYVITAVTFKDGNKILLDATEPYSTPNILPSRALNWKGREIIGKGESYWVDLSTVTSSKKEQVVMLKFTEDLIATGRIRTKYDKLNALNYRRKNNHIKKESLIANFEEKNKVEVIDFTSDNENKLSKPIVRNIKFESDGLVEEISNKLYIEPLLFLSEHTNPFKSIERKFPVEFKSKWSHKSTVLIEVPEGYKVEKLPTPLAIGLPNMLGVFKYNTVQIGKNISTNCSLEFNTAVIPVGYYQALKEFYGKVVQKESEKIVLVKN